MKNKEIDIESNMIGPIIPKLVHIILKQKKGFQNIYKVLNQMKLGSKYNLLKLIEPLNYFETHYWRFCQTYFFENNYLLAVYRANKLKESHGC